MTVIVDISYWQGLAYSDSPDDSGINYDLLASKADVVIMRASIGLEEDLRFQQNYEELHSRGVKLGAYHGHIDFLDSLTQAELFSSLIAGKEFEAGVYGDFERNSNGYSQSALASLYVLFLNNVITEYPLRIYTALWFWDTNIGTVLSDYFVTYELWFAHYTEDFNNLLIPYPWRVGGDWFLHQYSADGNGRGSEFGVISEDIDINRYNPDIIIPPPDNDFRFMVLTSTLNIRDKPTTNGSRILGRLHKDDVVVAKGFSVENGENVWVYHGLGWSAIVHKNTQYMRALGGIT